MERRKVMTTVIALVTAAIIALSSTLTSTNSLDVYAQEVITLRIGYFPNINHAQAVIGLGKGDFQKALGNNVKVETVTFNACHQPLNHYLPKE